jgi:hypothetical protein
MVGLCLAFKETVKLFAKIFLSFVILPIVYESTSHSALLPILGVVGLSNLSPSGGYRVTCHSGFHVQFPDVAFLQVFWPSEILF